MSEMKEEDEKNWNKMLETEYMNLKLLKLNVHNFKKE